MGRQLEIAVVGCSHGELDRIYTDVIQRQQQTGRKIDLLICCGDFQSVRNHSDLKCMACPPKYRSLQTFYKYYSGELEAPVLTLFVGGNHEASNYLTELPYGGWAAKNIYYMGYAGVVRFGGLRIAGLTGIYNGKHYEIGHFEHPPFTENTQRSFYHVRNVEIFRLKQLKDETARLDVVFSHDWPVDITQYGDSQNLFRRKQFLRQDAENGRLGNPHTMELIKSLKPRHWFSAHLHCRFTAEYRHEDNTNTSFLALDKPIPNRRYIEFMQIQSTQDGLLNEPELEYDVAWLAVLRSTDPLTNLKSNRSFMPGVGGPKGERIDYRPTELECEEIRALFNQNLKVPHNFVMTAPPHQDGEKSQNTPMPRMYINKQTSTFCGRLGVTDMNREFCSRADPLAVGVPFHETTNQQAASSGQSAHNPDQIDLDFDDAFEDTDEDFVIDTKRRVRGAPEPNPEEIEAKTNSAVASTEIENAAVHKAEESNSEPEPVRKLLHLPPPSKQEEGHFGEKEQPKIDRNKGGDEETGSSVEIEGGKLMDLVDEGEEEKGTNGMGTETDAGTAIKRFKRRNQALDEEDDD